MDDLKKALKTIEAQERAQIETAIKEQLDENNADGDQGGQNQSVQADGQDGNEDGQRATTE